MAKGEADRGVRTPASGATRDVPLTDAQSGDEGIDRPSPTPEKGVTPEAKPDTGTKQDLQHPDTAEKKLPVTASHDMDPPGQGGPEHAE